MAWFEAVPLQNDYVRLEPLRIDHSEHLFPTTDAETFRYWVLLQPKDRSPEAFQQFLERTLATSNCVSYAVQDRRTGRWAGKTSFMDIRPEAKGLEIGMTWLAAEFRNSYVNSAMKHLMLQHAFEDRGAIRVQLKTDARNAASARAILKIGAKDEGILRKHGIQPGGTVRDTHMFSIVDDEWPEVSRRLLARILEKVGKHQGKQSGSGPECVKKSM